MEDEYPAFCLDQAIAMLGNGISAQLNSVNNDAKAAANEAKLQRKIQQRLNLILQIDQLDETQYRSPPRR